MTKWQGHAYNTTDGSKLIIEPAETIPRLLRSIPQSVSHVVVFADECEMIGISFVRSYPYSDVWCCAITTTDPGYPMELE